MLERLEILSANFLYPTDWIFRSATRQFIGRIKDDFFWRALQDQRISLTARACIFADVIDEEGYAYPAVTNICPAKCKIAPVDTENGIARFDEQGRPIGVAEYEPSSFRELLAKEDK